MISKYNGKGNKMGTSLVVQWLRLGIPMQGGAGLILDQGTKIPHALRSKNQKIKNRSIIATNSAKTLKMIHIKIKKTF